MVVYLAWKPESEVHLGHAHVRPFRGPTPPADTPRLMKALPDVDKAAYRQAISDAQKIHTGHTGADVPVDKDAHDHTPADHESTPRDPDPDRAAPTVSCPCLYSYLSLSAATVSLCSVRLYICGPCCNMRRGRKRLAPRTGHR